MTSNTKRVAIAIGKWIENGQKRPRKYGRVPRCNTRRIATKTEKED